MLITREPEIARFAERAGVDRIFVDLEHIGKEARQGHLDTHRAHHTISDVRKVRSNLTSAELMVRINPLNSTTENEVNDVLAAGADRLMLPMFKDEQDVSTFRSIVASRAPVTYLAETASAVESLESWIPHLTPEDQVHFGLNDLSIDLGYSFLFEPLARRYLDSPARHLRTSEVDFGIGGLGRPGPAPIPSHVLMGEHVRLSSSWAILSRSFHGNAQNVMQLSQRVRVDETLSTLRDHEREWVSAGEDALAKNHQRLVQLVQTHISNVGTHA